MRRSVLLAFQAAIRREQGAWVSDPGIVFQQLYPHLWWGPAGIRPELRRLCAREERRRGNRPWIRRINAPWPEPTIELVTSTGGAAVSALRFHGGRLVAATEAGGLVAWQLGSGREERLDLGAGSVLAVGPAVDGRGLAVCAEFGVLELGGAGLHARIERELPTRAGAAAISPGGLLATGDQLGRTEVWSLARGEPVARHAGRRTPAQTVSFSADGRQVVSIGSSGRATLLDLDTGSARSVMLPAGIAFALSGSGDHAFWLGMRDGRLVGASSDLRRMTPGVELAGERLTAGSCPDGGERVALGCDSGAVYDVAPTAVGEAPPAAFRLPAPVAAVAWSREGALLAAADRDGRVEVHRAGPGADARETPPFRAATSPCWVAGAVVVGCEDGRARRVTDPETLDGALLPGPAPFSGPAAAATAAPVWAAAHGRGSWRAWDLEAGQERGGMGAAGGIAALAVSPDGELVVTAHEDGWVLAWDCASGAERARRRLHERTVAALAFSPAGDRLYTAGEDGRARAWDMGVARADLSRGEASAYVPGAEGPLAKVRLETRWETECGPVPLSLACSPDGEVLALGEAGLVRCLAARDGRPLWELEEGGRVASLAFSAGGEYLLALSADGTCRLWRLPERQVAARFVLTGGGIGVARGGPGLFFVTTRPGELVALRPEAIEWESAAAPVAVRGLPRFERSLDEGDEPCRTATKRS